VSPGISSETWGRGQRFGMLPIGNGRVFWYATLNCPAGEQDRGGELKKNLLRLFGSWRHPIGPLIEATDEGAILRNDLFDRPPVRHWGSGRVTLLGDAAHPPTPNLGQGACQALEDALVLAGCFSGQREAQRLHHRAVRSVRQDRAVGAATALLVTGWAHRARLRDGAPQTVCRTCEHPIVTVAERDP
jgi:2-polyprenyl-6-methoxyphenol hydroxylase-like FAD-dependent oxidoreductase